MSGSDPASVAVGLTLFRPSPAQVEAVCRLAAASPGPVLAFDNGGLPAGAAEALERAGIRLLSAGRNLGIAAALNALAETATGLGARRILLLDQDAGPQGEMLRALLAAADRLDGASPPLAVIGPRPLAGAGHKAPAYPVHAGKAPRDGLVPVDFLATSGSLVDLAAFARIGPFRADYFIDAVDLEWCFRAWARGYSCWMAPEAGLAHHVGSGTIRGPFGLAMPRQPLFRMATYLRNSAYGLRLPHLPAGWKLRQGLYLPVQVLLYWRDAGYRPRVLSRLLAALRDGLMGRLGPPRDLP